CLKLCWDQGARNLIPLLWRAGEILKANSHFHQLSQKLDADQSDDPGLNKSAAFQDAFQLIAGASFCERVGLVLLPSSGHPITVISDIAKNSFQFFNDGKIEGPVFSRVVLYNDEIWFRTVSELKSEGFQHLNSNPELDEAKYFCAVPL